MKINSLIVTLLLALSSALAVSTARAEATEKKETHPSKKTLEKYDTDKDGKLSDAEKAVWDADKEKAKAERKAKKEAKAGGAEEAAK